ncbi:hypothetical protein SYNPS1DRAFT_29382 [Syncephalis pseudoplumigaleata]|uniref:MHYT domain-containing protein n=1 Tax=Syncephalis pseudoplumigaleata TaxID=1712513 RepID=A0A4P9YXM3_9FUNG|nr:hypothetical protein SYNPS1DRAFT_29382 [Syncephalis pseudoplumigaleata]|eukprot:RKP24873.1 hypothetical protein SYNPS1DRAFT_29382 [Syncephalis pseudoplumigaleata]
MERPGTVTVTWDYAIVFLSYLVSVQGAWTTCQVLYQVHKTRNNARKNAWLALAAVALGGCAIWGMHFVGMLALRVNISMKYDPGLTVLSFLIPIIAARIAFQINHFHRINHFGVNYVALEQRHGAVANEDGYANPAVHSAVTGALAEQTASALGPPSNGPPSEPRHRRSRDARLAQSSSHTATEVASVAMEYRSSSGRRSGPRAPPPSSTSAADPFVAAPSTHEVPRTSSLPTPPQPLAETVDGRKNSVNTAYTATEQPAEQSSHVQFYPSSETAYVEEKPAPSVEAYFRPSSRRTKKTRVMASAPASNGNDPRFHVYEMGGRKRFTLVISSLPRIAASGFFLAVGICGMHYTGIIAMSPTTCTLRQVRVNISYSPGIIAASFVIAWVVATLALVLAGNLRDMSKQFIAALILGLGVCSMHYTGMSSMSYHIVDTTPDQSAVKGLEDCQQEQKNVSLIAVVLVMATSFLFSGLVGSATANSRDRLEQTMIVNKQFEQLILEKEAAERANHTKSAFVATMSHVSCRTSSHPPMPAAPY